MSAVQQDPRIGPNAILQVVAALREQHGETVTLDVLRHAGLAAVIEHPPEHMVSERDVIALHGGVRRDLGTDAARAVMIGAGIGTVFPISTVCLQNAVARSQMGIATGAANFFRALFSSLVVAVLGAIVLGGLGGVAGMSVEMLARQASANELSFAFRFVFLACGLVLTFGMCFLIAMEEKPLKGPTPPSGGATAPSAPATPIPSA